MAHVLLPLLLFFMLSVAAGSWLGRRSPHSAWRATWPWPAATGGVALSLLVWTIVHAGPGDEFLDLAVVAMTLLGIVSVALAWAGAMAGAMIGAGK